MPVYLEFNSSASQFQETTITESNDAILLVMDDSAKKLLMTVPSSIGMIAKRAAERQARGITKSGYQLRSGSRVGRTYELEILGEGGQLPERLKQSPREVY